MVSLLCPSFLWHCFSIALFYIPFALVFACFILLVQCFDKFLKCLIFQNSLYLIERSLKHCTPTIFQGSSPWATLIPNSMIVVWVLFCVQLFLSYYFFFVSFSQKLFPFNSFLISQFHFSDDLQNAQFPKIYYILFKHH